MGPLIIRKSISSHKLKAPSVSKQMAMTKRYGGAIEALDEAGKAEALAAARWKQTE